MSTLALRPADAFASAAEAKPKSSLLQSLIKAREARAKHRVLGFLATMDDARLQDLGFTADDISALRSGELRLPR